MDISYSARTRSAVSSARGSRVFRSRWNATRMRRQLDALNGWPVSQLRYILARHHQGDGAMAARTSMLHIRVDDDLKAEATEKLAKIGLTVSDDVRILLTRIAREGALSRRLPGDQEVCVHCFRSKEK